MDGSGPIPTEAPAPVTAPNAAGICFKWLFILTMFKNLAATTKCEETLTLLGLEQRLRASNAAVKGQLPLVKLARFGNEKTLRVQKDGKWTGGSLRHDANMKVITGVEVEHDAGKMSFDDAVDKFRKAGIVAIGYTTPSSTEVTPRWRFLCPCSGEYCPARRNALVGRLNGLLGGILSPECWTLSQSFYLGSVNDNPARVELIDGTPIDLHGELDAISIGKSGAAAKPGRVGRQSTITAALSSDGPSARLRDLLKRPGSFVTPAIHKLLREAVAPTTNAGGNRHLTLVAIAARVAQLGWPDTDIRALVLPIVNAEWGDGDWSVHLDRVLAWVRQREGGAVAAEPTTSSAMRRLAAAFGASKEAAQ